MRDSIRILIAEDHQLVRKGLCALLEAKSVYDVVGEATNGVEAVELYGTLQPDVVLMDLLMPRMGGIEAIKQIRQQDPEARILVLTSFTDDKLVIEALQVGACGYLLKDSAPDELLRAIESVHAGYNAINPAVTEALLRQLNAPPGPQAEPDPLTGRELEVLVLVAKGFSNQDIGGRLKISSRTVGTHISNMLEKLALENRTQLALHALRQGLAQLEPGEDS